MIYILGGHSGLGMNRKIRPTAFPIRPVFILITKF